MTTDTTIQTVALTPEKGPHFMKGVKQAKSGGGTFDGRVWHLPVMRFGQPNPVAANPGRYYLRLADSARCTLYSSDQGCPLHGETCAPEYK